MMWWRIMYENAKTHIVADSMKQALLDDCTKRGFTYYKAPPGFDPVEYAPIAPCDEWHLEFGGMVHQHEPNVLVGRFNGLTLSARADHVSMLVSMMRKLIVDSGPRFFDGGAPYRKVYAWTSCVVLTPQQFDQLLARLVLIAPSAEMKAARFFAELEKKPSWRRR
jgi:hypothetical protein